MLIYNLKLNNLKPKAMEKSLSIVAFLFMCCIVNAQSVKKTFMVCSKTFEYTVTVNTENSLTIDIKDADTPANKADGSYTGTSIDDFSARFLFLLTQAKAAPCTAADNAKIAQEGKDIWKLLRISMINAIPQSVSKSIALNTNSYIYSAAYKLDNSIEVSIEQTDDASHQDKFSYIGSDVNAFMSLFLQSFTKVLVVNPPTDAEKNVILHEGNDLWMKLITIRPLPLASYAPEAGQLSIAPKIKYYIPAQLKRFKRIYWSVPYEVQDVHIEINSGFIENIRATLLVKGHPKVFENYYGIGFTSTENINKLDSVRLYEKGAPAFLKRFKPEQIDSKYKGVTNAQWDSILVKDSLKIYTFLASHHGPTFIYLGELLSYKTHYEVDRRDYSPRDTSIVVFGGQNLTLYKEETNKLFEAHIFSDFVGLNDDKPNGLIQTEVAKRININSHQWRTCKALYPFVKSFGIFQFITPSVTLSKLEQHNKRLVLGDLDSLRINSDNNDLTKLDKNVHRYTTPLQLYQYQSFSAGVNLNVLFFSNHNLKYNLYVNMGARLGITPVTDSTTTIDQNNITKTGVTNDFAVNTLQLVPEARLLFLPEERFNLSIAYQMTCIKSFSNQVQMLTFDKNDPTKFIAKKSQWLSTYELLMSFNTSKNNDNKLFGRVRFTSESNNYNNNFAQVQIGYSAYILAKSK